MNMGEHDKSGNGRFDRISDQTRGLVDDVKEWVDLRVKLVQLDMEERIEAVANEALSTLLILTIASGSLLFLLIAAAFALGDLLGVTSFGFAGIGILLAVVAWAISRFRPRLVHHARIGQGKKPHSASAKKQLSAHDERQATELSDNLHPGQPDLQKNERAT